MNAVRGRDPWLVLGVSRAAEDDEIKRAFRRLARQHHPDHNPDDPDAEALFRDVSAAYDQIKNAESRAALLGSAPAAPPRANGRTKGRTADAAADWDSVFKSAADQTRGRDLEMSIEIGFQQAFSGTEVEVQTNVEELCATCAGTGAAPGTMIRPCSGCNGNGTHRVGRIASTCDLCGGSGNRIERSCTECTGGRVYRRRSQRIAIPPGVYDGQQLVVDGAGEHGTAGPGDLLVSITVRPSPVFERLEGGDDLLLQIPVTYAEACLGAEIRIPTPDQPIVLRLPPNSGSGPLLRVRGRGMTSVESGERGDLYVRVMVEVPEKLSSAERRLITQLRAHDKHDPRAALFSALEADPT